LFRRVQKGKTHSFGIAAQLFENEAVMRVSRRRAVTTSKPSCGAQERRAWGLARHSRPRGRCHQRYSSRRLALADTPRPLAPPFVRSGEMSLTRTQRRGALEGGLGRYRFVANLPQPPSPPPPTPPFRSRQG
jgi:hypothetical protein